MAKARPLRKTGRKTGGKSVKERQLSSAEMKRSATKRPAKPVVDAAASRKSVPLRPTRKAVVAVPERQIAPPEVAPPLPAPIASFTF